MLLVSHHRFLVTSEIKSLITFYVDVIGRWMKTNHDDLLNFYHFSILYWYTYTHYIYVYYNVWHKEAILDLISCDWSLRFSLPSISLRFTTDPSLYTPIYTCYFPNGPLPFFDILQFYMIPSDPIRFFLILYNTHRSSMILSYLIR